MKSNKVDMVKLKSLFASDKRSINPSKYPDEVFTLFSIPSYDVGKPEKLFGSDIGSSKVVLENQDVLLSRIVPHIKRCWIVNSSGNHRMIGSGEWIVFRLPKGVNPKFLRYYLSTNRFQKKFLQTVKGVGGSLMRADPNRVGEFEIRIPPTHVQDKIIAILDKTNVLRERDEQFLALYKQLAQSIFHDLFGDPFRNEKKWNVRNVGKAIESIRYGTSTPPVYSVDGVPFIRATNIKSGEVVRKGMVYLSEIEAEKIDKCKIFEGDLLIVRSGANTGEAAIVSEEYDQAYAGYDLIVTAEKHVSCFYNFLINSDYGQKVIKPLSRRAGQPHLNAEQVKDLKFIYPDEDLLKKFYSVMQNINQQKRALELQTNYSNSLYQALLQNAFESELVIGG